jgi:hypothetical protein
MPKECDRRLVELALRLFRNQLLVPQTLQDQLHVLLVLFCGSAEDQDIIKVGEHELVLTVSKHVVHQGLKRSRGIRESERHHHELVRPIPRADTGFGDILLSNPNLVISRPQINSGKVRCASKTIKQLVLTRDRTLVLHCKLVQSSVLYSASPIRLA